MKQVSVMCLAVCMVLLGLSGVGQAQPPGTVQVQGTIRAVDCQASTVTLDTPSGSNAYRAALSASIIVNSAGVPLCALQQYLGALANVWLTAIGSELVITRIDAVAQTYQPPPAPAPAVPAPAVPVPYGYPYPAYYPAPVYYPPLAGLVFGTILVGGLTYLLARGPYGYFYRYPYYGPYYGYYYRPYYHPYWGGFRYAPGYMWTGRGWSWHR